EIRNWPTNPAAPHAVEVANSQRTIRNVDGRLRDAVHVDELWLTVAMCLEPGLEALQLERLTSEDDEAQREFACTRTSLISSHELAESRRRLIEHRDLLTA